MKKMISVCLSLAFALSLLGAPCARAEDELTVALMMTNGAWGNYVCYPQIEGSTDEKIQSINQAITQTAEIEKYLNLLPTLDENSVGLRVRTEYSLRGGILSVLISAEGKMPRGRPGQKNYAMMFDTLTGEKIALGDLLSDPEAGVSRLEELLDTDVSAILSTYMENDQLLPIPTENFTVLHDALLLCYDADQLTFLSGDSGAVSFRLYELSDILDVGEGSVIARLSKPAPEDVRAAIAADANAGRLPGLSLRPDVNVALHASFDAAAALLRNTIDPSEYSGEMLFEMEDPFLRGTYLLTDADGAAIIGLVSGRLDFYGIQTGVTARDEWRAILGEPTETETRDECEANKGYIEPVENDVYAFDSGNTLTLSADENGILRFVILQ